MSDPILFGATYSVYVRSARLALEEKGVRYASEEIDIFAPGGPPAAYRERHPFGRIPAFEHDGFRLYETGAIIRYVDEAFPGPKLQPATPKRRARMNQAISVIDNYGYRTLVWDIFVERVSKKRRGQPADEQKVAAAVPTADRCLDALQAIMADAPYLAGDQPTLADLHAAPMFAYFRLAAEGAVLMARHPQLHAWWDRMAGYPSIRRVCTTPAN
jgi:glutathione S-transferase